MTAFLIDTNVVSELVKPAPNRFVPNFLAHESDLWLSVISLHELSFGAARIADVGRRNRLMAWIESLKATFSGRLIVIDQAIAELAGRGRAQAMAEGHTVDPLDALIAASAQSRSMTLATRNVRDFVALDVIAFNPWNN